MVLFGAGCGSDSEGGNGSPTAGDGNTSPTISGDLCTAFPSSWVADSSGKTIIKTAKSKIASVSDCQYFITETVGGGGKRIDLIHEHLDIEIQKKARDIAGSRWENGNGFALDAVLLYDSKDNLTDVDILLGPNQYLRINSLQGALTSEELIAFGKKVAEYIKSGKAHGAYKAGDEASQSSSQTGNADAKNAAQNFFDAIGNDPSAASALMEGNKANKDMWKMNFSAISSLTVKSLEPVFQSEWTSERETYKATLEVKTKGGDTYGWDDGSNTRWITMQKSGDEWLVGELANNP